MATIQQDKISEILRCTFCGSGFTIATKRGERWCRKCGSSLLPTSKVKEKLEELGKKDGQDSS